MTLNMAVKVFFAVVLTFSLSLSLVNCANEAIDSSFLESVLNAEECRRQVRAIRRNAMLLLQFSDAGLRTPRGVLEGNTVDMGNYHQCLGINHQLDDMHIEGKYCSIRVPLNQTFRIPRPWDVMASHFNPSSLRLDIETISNIEEYEVLNRQMSIFRGNYDGFEQRKRSIQENPLLDLEFKLAICIPKPCTTEQAINSLFFNITAIGFNYTDYYCRLPGDKPWVTADYVAVALFSVIGFVTLVSTSYDLLHRFIFKKDVKQMSTLGRSFSLYTNGQRLMTFSSSAGSLQCVDGIRVLALLWVIIGHSYSTEPFISNNLDVWPWLLSANSLWITAATMTVDTFFTLAGVLLVYTTAGKMNQIKFIKNLHWFYLNRYIRVTVLLAATVLMQASYFNQMADGPHWVTVASHTEQCRERWWYTLLHVQNFFFVFDMCVIHSWYVAIDFQLYLVSPLVLYWVFTGNKRLGWIAVISGLAAVLIGSSIYAFYHNLQGGVVVPSRPNQLEIYYRHHYFNTLGRASPFFVGLVGGYLLHICRKKEVRMPWYLVIFVWACAAGILSGIFYYKYRIKQMDWNNQLIDNLINSFMRPSYAAAICWLIFACVHGYAGPINWFLSLDVWRLPARLSYGMYLFHFPLMFTLNATKIAPIYFTVESFAFKFLSHLTLSLIYSFGLTLLLESPVMVLYKQLIDSVTKKTTQGKPAGKEIDYDYDKKNENVDKSNINASPTNPKENDVNFTSNGDPKHNISSVIENDNNSTEPNTIVTVVDVDKTPKAVDDVNVIRIDGDDMHIVSDMSK